MTGSPHPSTPSSPSAPWSATEAADRAAEAVRTLNHLTGWDGYREPADVSAVLADLARLAYGLPQALSTAGRWLTNENRAGRLGHDQNHDRAHAGVDVTAAVRQLDVDLLAAALAARQLSASLNAAHQTAAHLLTVTTDPDSDPEDGSADLDAEDRSDPRGGAA